MLTVTWVVPCGLMGAVLATVSEPREIASAWERLDWFVTMNTIGPAPTDAGETETDEALTDTLRLMGLGGRASVGDFPPVAPQLVSAKAVTAVAEIVLMPILDPALLSRDPSAERLGPYE